MTSSRVKNLKYELDTALNNLGIYIADLTDKELRNFEKIKVVNKEANSIRLKLVDSLENVYLKMKSLEMENEHLQKRNYTLLKIVEYRDKIEELRKEL